jgi:hypothetical protein
MLEQISSLHSPDWANLTLMLGEIPTRHKQELPRDNDLQTVNKNIIDLREFQLKSF